MPEISRIVERRGRVKVFVDGEFWAELDGSVAAEHGVREGVMLSESELGVARVAGERPLAMERALHILGYRARSENELRDRLLRVGYASETVAGVLSRLRDLGYLDDEEFARNAARAKAERYGPRRIYGDLRQKGVREDLAREAAEAQFSEGAELAAAHLAASRRYNAEEGSDAVARRVYGFLARRGFSAGVCSEVAKQFRSQGSEE